MADVESVTFVTVSDAMGGGELFTLRLSAALSGLCDAGIAGVPGTPVVEKACDLGLRVEGLQIGRKLSRRTAAAALMRYPVARSRLNRFVDAGGRGDWVILQYSWEKLLWRGRSRGASVAVLEHGPLPGHLLKIPVSRRAIRGTLLGCDVLLSVSEPATASARSVAERAPRTLHAGVDRDRAVAAVEARDTIREMLDVEPGHPLLAYAGRLAPEKGVFDLLEIAAKDRDCHLLMLGSGPAEERLRATARLLGIGERLHLTGFVDEPLPYLAAADAVCMLRTGPGEGRPLLALESLSVGTPVVGSSHSAALAALAAEGHYGIFLADSSDPGTVRLAIREAVGLPRRRVALPDWTDTAAEFFAILAGGSS